MFKCAKCEFFDTKDGNFGLCVIDGLCRSRSWCEEEGFPFTGCPQLTFEDLEEEYALLSSVKGSTFT